MKMKKILVFIVILISIIILFFIRLFKQNSNADIEKIKIADYIKSNIIKPASATIQEEAITEQQDNQEQINEQQEEMTGIKIEDKTIKTNEKAVNTADNTKSTNEKNTKKQEIKVQETTPVKTETQTAITKQESTSTSQSNVESFKVNNSIIAQMKNIINSNPSTYMKQFGYNIVVDSSIVNQATGFTYTEARVKNSIVNSFGTIRIYARDYYVGNELRWTESFIL